MAQGGDEVIMIRDLDTGEMIPLSDMDKPKARRSSFEKAAAKPGGTKPSAEKVAAKPESKPTASPSEKAAARPVVFKDAKTTKNLCRRGISEDGRAEAWQHVTGADKILEENPLLYSHVVQDVFGESPQDDFPQVPTFGAHHLVHDLVAPHLTPALVTGIKRLLLMANSRHPHAEYCPLLPPISAMLITHMPEPEAYTVLHAVLLRCEADRWYIPTNKTRASLCLLNFSGVLEKHYPKMFAHMHELGVVTNSFAKRWFHTLFLGTLDYTGVLRVLDCLLLEGIKIMFRVAIGILKVSKEELFACTTAEAFLEVIEKLSNLDIEKVLKKAFELRNFSRKLLERLADKHKGSTHDVSVKELDGTTQHFYRPTIAKATTLVTPEQWGLLWSWLPSSLQHAEGMLLFNSAVDGCSFKTFLDKCDLSGPSVLLVKDTRGHIFGCFSSHSWTKSSNHFGDGSCFLFRLSPEPKAFKWVHGNDYFMMFHMDFLSMGGGTAYGLRLDQDMSSGVSLRCETFDNEPLAGDVPDGRFDVSKVEVYGIA